jgi:alpha 1,3-mannosyltransferase
MFPFIRNPSRRHDPKPLASIRESNIPGSSGIIIPVVAKDFRFAYHLVLALRAVLPSTLPIQIAHAGDGDLPTDRRLILSPLEKNIEFLDITSILENGVMKLEKSWAIKPFAALASTFEKVIVVDADAVFLQAPEKLVFSKWLGGDGHTSFSRSAPLAAGFPEHHEWWIQQMRHQKPAKALTGSRVWTQGYAEEADSGVVVLDKAKLPIFVGLLHVCWQNTKPVRDEATYIMTYEDKDSWWFGLEFCGVPHASKGHYRAVLSEHKEKDGILDFYGFTIAHLDEKNQLIWYNGSLLKNKAIDQNTFLAPSHWMVDGV